MTDPPQGAPLGDGLDRAEQQQSCRYGCMVAAGFGVAVSFLTPVMDSALQTLAQAIEAGALASSSKESSCSQSHGHGTWYSGEAVDQLCPRCEARGTSLGPVALSTTDRSKAALQALQILMDRRAVPASRAACPFHQATPP